jgi:hypothetical protein
MCDASVSGGAHGNLKAAQLRRWHKVLQLYLTKHTSDILTFYLCHINVCIRCEQPQRKRVLMIHNVYKQRNYTHCSCLRLLHRNSHWCHRRSLTYSHNDHQNHCIDGSKVDTMTTASCNSGFQKKQQLANKINLLFLHVISVNLFIIACIIAACISVGLKTQWTDKSVLCGIWIEYQLRMRAEESKMPKQVWLAMCEYVWRVLRWSPNSSAQSVRYIVGLLIITLIPATIDTWFCYVNDSLWGAYTKVK